MPSPPAPPWTSIVIAPTTPSSETSSAKPSRLTTNPADGGQSSTVPSLLQPAGTLAIPRSERRNARPPSNDSPTFSGCPVAGSAW
jgi:hypothetical protein